MESIAELLAGFAFFLVGLKLFSSNLNQLTSHRFRAFITHYTPNDFVAGLWGSILSIFTAGNTFLTPCVAGGLLTVKALTLRKAIMITIWSRVGSCFYIYLAGINIKLFVMFLIGITGISYAISKPKKLTTLAASTFSLGLVLFGIQEIKSSTKVLVTLPWFENLIQYTYQYPFIAFIAGVLFIICAQSLFGALVITVGFVASGVFNIQQALLFIYGLYLGEAILKIFYLPVFKRAFKKTIVLLPIFYFVAFFIGTLFFIAEHLSGIPITDSFYSLLDTVPRRYIAHINFGIHLLTAILLSFNISTITKILERLVKPEVKEPIIREVDIPAEILVDPSMTMALIQMEEHRLVENLPLFMENLRSGRSLRNPRIQRKLHEDLDKNFGIIRSVYSDLLEKSNYDKNICAPMLKGIERQNLLMSLENNLYEFGQAIDKLRLATEQTPALSNKFLGFVEAIDIILLTLIDVINTQDPFNIQTLKEITSERKDLMAEIKAHYEAELTIEQQVSLINLVNLFESTIWIIKKISPLVIAPVPEPNQQG